MSEDKERHPEDVIYSEEDWDRVREEIRLHDEEKLAGLVCYNCSYRYRKGEEGYRYCPDCGHPGPGHPDAELKDIE